VTAGQDDRSLLALLRGLRAVVPRTGFTGKVSVDVAYPDSVVRIEVNYHDSAEGSVHVSKWIVQERERRVVRSLREEEVPVVR
jgi:hypothetical protein